MLTQSKTSILVVDDEELIRDVVCLMIESLGYEPTSARHAIEALSLIQMMDGFQLVLTDINMPIIDGWEFARRLRELKPCLPIVACTGESPNNIFPRLKGSGICHALFKPVKMNLLGDALASILETPGDGYAIDCLETRNEDLGFKTI
jgi:CheY-like chemotaxis protein